MAKPAFDLPASMEEEEVSGPVSGFRKRERMPSLIHDPLPMDLVASYPTSWDPFVANDVDDAPASRPAMIPPPLRQAQPRRPPQQWAFSSLFILFAVVSAAAAMTVSFLVH